MTPDPQSERFRQPLPLARLVSGAAPERVAAVGAPVPREQVTDPIAPGPTPLDTQLFQDPKIAGKTYWLPRYHLAEETVSGQERYRIGFSVLDGAWRLTIRLEPRPAPGMDEAAARSEVLEHELDILLSYAALGAQSTRKTLRFQEILRSDDGVEATLLFTGLPQRDEVFLVLGDPQRAPELIVQRKIRVAVQQTRETARTEAGTVTARTVTATGLRITPLVTAIRPPIVIPTPQPPALPAPQIAYLGAQRVSIRGVQFDRHEIGVANWKAYHASLFAPAPNLPPCGRNDKASRTWVDILDGLSGRRLYGYCALGSPANLQKLTVTVKAGTPPPQTLRLQLTDRQTNRKAVSNAVRTRPAAPPPPPPPQFIAIESDMAQTVEPAPFAFSRDLHAYIFTGLGQQPGNAGGGAATGLLRHRKTHGGAVHAYFQDAAERTLFFHLPDEFRIARRGGGFRPPMMTLRVRSNGGSIRNTDVTWDFAVTPWTTPARLQEARVKLADAAGAPPEEVELQPLVTSAVTFTIQRPTEAGRVTEKRPSSSLLLEGPIVDTLAVPAADFQLAYDAMLGRTASVLSGQVAVEIEGWDMETRPFIADFARLAGPVVDLAASLDEAAGALSIEIANAIESPVMLDSLALSAARGGASLPLDLVDAIAPGAIIPAGEALTVSIPAPALPGAGEITVAATADAAPALDDAAIMDAILDRATLEYFREVDVRALSFLFVAPAGRPGDQVVAILVDFEGGETVDMSADKTQAFARIDYPFEDVMNRKVAGDGGYRYTRTVVRADGRQDVDAEPQTGDTDILFLSAFP